MSLPIARPFLRRTGSYVCCACRRNNARLISTSAPLQSGHSKWATIKHDKAKNDAAKNKQRAMFSHDIALATKLGGPNPAQNPRLALAIEKAKKASLPKAIIETAIARGQGISATGAALESVTIEAMLPPSVAVVIDCETDNKLRTLADVKNIIRKAGLNATPVSYLFERKGKVVFKAKDGVGADELLEPALEAGALDVEEGEEGTTVVFTDPAATKAVAEGIAKTLELEIDAMDIIWDPNEDTMVTLEDEETVAKLKWFLEHLNDEVSGVQAVYMNVKQGSMEDGAWADLMSSVTA